MVGAVFRLVVLFLVSKHPSRVLNANVMCSTNMCIRFWCGVFGRSEISFRELILLLPTTKLRIHHTGLNIFNSERKLIPTLFNAARLMTLTPILSALRIACSICLLIPSRANGKKYCKVKNKFFFYRKTLH